MYLPSSFEETSPARLEAFIARHPLGTLFRGGPGGPSADHLPFLLDVSGVSSRRTLRAHCARANPLWREAPGSPECLVVFHGPSAYVSPAWYPTKAETGKVVPTYNYSVVHARGRLRVIDDRDWLRRMVDDLTHRFEGPRDAPWQVTDAPADYIDAMLRAIVGIEIEVVELVGKFKLSQNKTPAERQGVIDGMARELAATGAPNPFDES
jgi:transcriptional regulator